MLKREMLEQPDGAVWESFEIKGGKIVLTSKGRELFRERPETWKELRSYKKRAMGAPALQSFPVVREHFASGGNSDVYTLSEGLAVKEAHLTGSLFFTVERMDRLLNVVESNVPRWIDIPDHYGLLFASHLRKQYLLMQKIDSGVTVQNVLTPGEMSDEQAAALEAEFGDIGQAEVDEVGERYEEAHDILTASLEDRGYNPAEYLTDWHEGNVLVERLETPVAGSPLKMWVIDQ